MRARFGHTVTSVGTKALILKMRKEHAVHSVIELSLEFSNKEINYFMPHAVTGERSFQE
jgi:predicted nucleotidyltransferase